MANCAFTCLFSGVMHFCNKPKGHIGAHTSGSASWGAHEWISDDPRWPSATKDLTCCVRCGVVQRADGQNKACRGVLPEITMRRVDKTTPAFGECDLSCWELNSQRDELLAALKGIVALDLGKDANGGNEFHAGAERFRKAHAIAKAAIANLEDQ